MLFDNSVGRITIADSARAVMIRFGTTSFAGKRRVQIGTRGLQPLNPFCPRACTTVAPPGLSGRCPQKILFIAEELLASPLRQSRVVAEIVAPKIPQQISAPSLIIFLASTNTQQIEIGQPTDRPEPTRPRQIGFNEPEPAEPSRVVVRIFDLP